MLVHRSDGTTECSFCATTIAEGVLYASNDDAPGPRATICAFCVPTAGDRIQDYRGHQTWRTCPGCSLCCSGCAADKYGLEPEPHTCQGGER
jgi:hypothetical protein